jgi:glyoxylase-like metal-dependent hydrolase (beta-lactamase superfamily II)
MFGNAPKAVWERWIAPDQNNQIPLACRCLLVREPTRTVLCEAGIGAFFTPQLRQRYGVVEERHVLLESLSALGVSPSDIDVIVLSHLHFDHAGGLLDAYRAGATPALVFPRASYIVGEEAWQRAVSPHPRDRASFIPGLTDLLQQTGRIERVTGDRSAVLGDGFRFHRSNGHTPGLLLTEIAMPAGPIVFAADLVPGAAWVHLPITMGYDRNPELLVDEKTALLGDLLARSGRLFFTHDPKIALGTIAHDDGKYHVVSTQPAIRDLAS